MKKVIVAALGATVAITALTAGTAGPNTLTVPPEQNPVTAATTQCQERLAGLALVLTSTHADGSVTVVYRCER